MIPTFYSFLVYVTAMHLVAGAIYYAGRRERLRWSVAEYLFLYLPWGLLLVLAMSVFGTFDQAVAELQVSTGMLAFFSLVAGVLGGLSILPRVLFSKHKMNHLLVTGITSFILATIYIKFVFLVFLFAASAPPVSPA